MGEDERKRSGNRKSLQCHSIQRALAAWGGDGFIELILSLFAQPLRVVSGKDDRESGSDSSTVAPFGTDTLTALLAKHPILPPPVMPGSLPLEPSFVVDVDSVLGCIQSFPKGTSCRRDGLRAQHIFDALCGEGSAIAVGLLKAIFVVVNLLLEGRCPKVLAEFMATAPLASLLKPDNVIRPIAVVECLRAPHAQNFLTVIPIEGLGQHMSALEYRTILKYRLMIPLFSVDEPCLVCHKVCLDSFGEHAVHCKELPGFKYRHDLVSDVQCDVLKRVGISSKKEAPVNFLTDPLEGRSTLRPADILVFGWAEGKHACVDLTGVSPLVGLRENGFVAGQSALKAESSKVAKHEKACLENQHVFILFAFDTFGFLAPEVEEFLTRVQRVVQSNFSTPKTQNFIFSRIGFAI
uniref:Putative reverse transcriptase domain-containing protein n=1 Tax=Tanacetum cinerariifolium TaxID=118510 RepID=A0A699JBU5_TANCI|nr:putative reverse transcriptase domain-containing protein [Tanacetum cinerariifolium]